MIGVVSFPGSNCEHDVVAALESLGAQARVVWHGETTLDVSAVVLPGGFAHGDYLRPGAIARFSPVMGEVRRLASDGAPVLGICNGFQVLTEASLLPGALRRNDGLRFLCERVKVVVSSLTSVITTTTSLGRTLELPINHYEGSYFCDAATLDSLEKNGQIVLRYLDNPNGSIASIAGISNVEGNVVGLMPHPERASDLLLGSVDGNVLLESFIEAATHYAARALVGVSPRSTGV